MIKVKLPANVRLWRPPTQQELMMVTLYDHPSDFPDDYVLRASYLPGLAMSSEIVAFKTIQEAATWMNTNYPYMTFMQRHPEDEPQIVGVWL